MIGDIGYCVKDQKYFRLHSRLLETVSLNPRFHVIDYKNFLKTFGELINYKDTLVQSSKIDKIPRVFLGRPEYQALDGMVQENAQIIDEPAIAVQGAVQPSQRNDVYGAIASGMPDEQIMSVHGLSKMQLAGHKAYASRSRNSGSHNNGSSVKAKNGNSFEFSLDEKIAINELYEEGFSSVEISGLFPGITWQKIAALVAKRNGESRAIDEFKALRPLILQRDNYRCQKCYITEDAHRKITADPQKDIKGHGLHVHHINYDHEDSREDNMISLCSACHGMTNTVQQGLQLRKEFEAMMRIRYSMLLNP
jgi:hypothetical protein